MYGAGRRRAVGFPAIWTDGKCNAWNACDACDVCFCRERNVWEEQQEAKPQKRAGTEEQRGAVSHSNNINPPVVF